MERSPLPHVAPDSWELSPEGLLVPDRLEKERVRRESTCFCGNDATEVYEGWGLCPLCAPGVKRRHRRMNRKPARMAIPKGKQRRPR